VLPLTRAAIAVGADGLLIDVHPQPKTALCDGDQALPESDIREIADIIASMSPLMGRMLAVPSDEFGQIPAGVAGDGLLG
jgi:3-deoxy-7-phosphoheptulonate synthase